MTCVQEIPNDNCAAFIFRNVRPESLEDVGLIGNQSLNRYANQDYAEVVAILHNGFCVTLI